MKDKIIPKIGKKLGSPKPATAESVKPTIPENSEKRWPAKTLQMAVHPWPAKGSTASPNDVFQPARKYVAITWPKQERIANSSPTLWPTKSDRNLTVAAVRWPANPSPASTIPAWVNDITRPLGTATPPRPESRPHVWPRPETTASSSRGAGPRSPQSPHKAEGVVTTTPWPAKPTFSTLPPGWVNDTTEPVKTSRRGEGESRSYIWPDKGRTENYSQGLASQWPTKPPTEASPPAWVGNSGKDGKPATPPGIESRPHVWPVSLSKVAVSSTSSTWANAASAGSVTPKWSDRDAATVKPITPWAKPQDVAELIDLWNSRNMSSKGPDVYPKIGATDSVATYNPFGG